MTVQFRKKDAPLMSSEIREKIQEYWEQPTTVSIIDANLHELEIAAASRYLEPTDRLADVGSGNGAATVRYARKVRECVGLERSAHMRRLAAKTAENAGLTSLTFREFDILGETIP